MAEAQPILVVGSVALDDIETPTERRPESLGGSGTFFSATASLFAPVRVVAVVGDDFPEAHLDALRHRAVDLSGLERVPGRTFRWRGRYGADFGDAETLDTQLNVFEHFDPKIPASHRASPVVFLANIHPALQLKVLDQIEKPRLVGLDTMNFWITGERTLLGQVLSRIDVLVINETEAELLSGEANIFRAADRIRAMGPQILVIKRGRFGALLFHPDGVFFVPAVPLRDVVDPTGAGDTFAAGMMGWLAAAADDDFATFKRAVVNGTVTASFAVQGFSLDRVLSVGLPEIQARTAELLRLMDPN
ncbi:MAG: sugar kinase [Myxococcales bacterium]|nr:sugar kinase [Myxococcales bacterium]